MPLVRAAILALVVALGALVPQAAVAHGGHAHKAAEAQAAKPKPLASKTAFAAPAVASEAAPLCPPGGTGHVCGCGNLTVCAGSKAQVAIPPLPAVWLKLSADTGVPPRADDPVLANRPFALRRPRAPPQAS
jgi:hypothetical protein